jgi:hypothetical protein
VKTLPDPFLQMRACSCGLRVAAALLVEGLCPRCVAYDEDFDRGRREHAADYPNHDEDQ